MARAKKLTPGAVAHVFRAGGGVGDQQGQHMVPADGSNLHIRDLAPGAYDVRDSTGREVSFEVGDREEYVVIPVLGAKGEPEGDDSPNPHAGAAPRLHEGRRAAGEQSWLPHYPDGHEHEVDLNAAPGEPALEKELDAEQERREDREAAREQAAELERAKRSAAAKKAAETRRRNAKK